MGRRGGLVCVVCFWREVGGEEDDGGGKGGGIGG